MAGYITTDLVSIENSRLRPLTRGRFEKPIKKNKTFLPNGICGIECQNVRTWILPERNYFCFQQTERFL